MASMRRLYKHYSEVNQSLSDSLNSTALMSVGEWMAFMDHIGMFETKQLSTNQARMIYMWSRIRAVADYSDESRNCHGAPCGE